MIVYIWLSILTILLLLLWASNRHTDQLQTKLLDMMNEWTKVIEMEMEEFRKMREGG